MTQEFQSLSATLSQDAGAAGSLASMPDYKTHLEFPQEGRVFLVEEKIKAETDAS